MDKRKKNLPLSKLTEKTEKPKNREDFIDRQWVVFFGFVLKKTEKTEKLWGFHWQTMGCVFLSQKPKKTEKPKNREDFIDRQWGFG